jgi:hypothetical protein
MCGDEMRTIRLFPCALLVFAVCGCLARAERTGSGTNLLSLDSNDSGKRVAVVVAQAIEITLHTIGPQQYGAPKISSPSVRYESVALKMPPNPGGTTQMLRFRAVAEGEASILLISVNPENVFAVTVEVGPATTPVSPPPVPDQANTAAWASAWTNLLNDTRQKFIPSRPRLTSTEVELVVANPGPTQDAVTLTLLNSTGEALVQVSKIVQAADCAHVTFVYPNGGLAVSPGQAYYIRIDGGDLFGWKYTKGGYKHGAASFNGKPLLSDGNFLFRTYADD